MIPALLTCLAAGLLPQGSGSGPGIPENRRPVLDFPADTGVQRFGPFVDGRGRPVRVDFRAAGTADLDGDGNQDAWFLAGPGPGQGRISVQMARTSSLGRFRPWYVYPPGPWVAAATHRTRGKVMDRILLVDPSSDHLGQAFYYYHASQRPREGLFLLDPGRIPVGRGAYEIATRDDASDGCDDILLLLRAGADWTLVKKLVMKNVGGFPAPVAETSALVPARLEKLRALDLEGDGRSDVLLNVPGFGILALTDDGGGSFELAWFAGVTAGVRDLFTGDLDEDGRDDVGLVVDGGAVVWRSTPAGFSPRALARPTSSPPFASALVLDATSDGVTDVVAFTADGRSLVVFPAQPGGGFGPVRVRRPGDPEHYAGPGPSGLPLVDADVDGDGDVDVLMQLPSGDGWITLRNEQTTDRPSWLIVEDGGEVGETGFLRQEMRVRFGEATTRRGLSEVEVAVFLEDPTTPGAYLYWGRLTPGIDAAGEARFRVYTQTMKNRLAGMVQQHDPFEFPDGITAGGDTLLSIHARAGPRRHESMLAHRDPGGDGGKSAKGVKWTVRPAPPRAAADEDLLPWN